MYGRNWKRVFNTLNHQRNRHPRQKCCHWENTQQQMLAGIKATFVHCWGNAACHSPTEDNKNQLPRPSWTTFWGHTQSQYSTTDTCTAMLISGVFTIKIRNRTKLKSISGGMAKENRVYIENGILFGHKKQKQTNEIIAFAGKWTDGTTDHY